jgi:hypothetical protein
MMSHMDDNLLNANDLADVFAMLDTMEDVEEEETKEEAASRKRYEEIIKKHKDDNE